MLFVLELFFTNIYILYDDLSRYTDLTTKFYADKLLKTIHRSVCIEETASFFNLPPDQQFIDKAAILFSRWFSSFMSDNLKEVSLPKVFCYCINMMVIKF